MKVLVVYAHHNPRSFTHAVLDQVTKGLEDGGHSCTVNDLNAIGFDPVFRPEDGVQFAHESVPEELLEEMDPGEAVLEMAGGPMRRWMAKRWLRDKDVHEIVREIGKAQAQGRPGAAGASRGCRGPGLRCPGLLDGLPGDPQGLGRAGLRLRLRLHPRPEGWKGNLDGRVPMLTQEKGLILTPTFFTEEEYDKGWREAMDTVLCDWGLKMAGVKEAHHAYFYAVTAASDEQRQEYLQEAYRLGREF